MYILVDQKVFCKIGRKPRKKRSRKGEETTFYRTWSVSINKMKYLYLVTHYYWNLKGENLFDDVHYKNYVETTTILNPLYSNQLLFS